MSLLYNIFFDQAADGLLSSDVVDTETNLTVEAVAFQQVRKINSQFIYNIFFKKSKLIFFNAFFCLFQETLTDGDTSGGQTESVVLADLDPAEETSSVSCAVNVFFYFIKLTCNACFFIVCIAAKYRSSFIFLK